MPPPRHESDAPDDGSLSRRAVACVEALCARELWESFGRVAAAYAFGSRCEGHSRPGSDLDVGVAFDPPTDNAELAKLEAALQRRAGAVTVDLVVLNGQGWAFQYSVISRGRLLFERTRSARARYEARVLTRYFDFLPTLHIVERYHTRGIRRRLGLK